MMYVVTWCGFLLGRPHQPAGRREGQAPEGLSECELLSRPCDFVNAPDNVIEDIRKYLFSNLSGR